MPRRRSPEKRKVLPDPKYKDVVLAKFMNNLMKDGKKSVAEKIVYGAFDIVSKKTEKSPIDTGDHGQWTKSQSRLAYISYYFADNP